MQALQDKLAKQLEKNTFVTIKQRRQWELPVLTVETSFHRIKRFRLDILMRMVLHVIDEMPVRRAAAVAELLVVEELFIQDLLEKLSANGLIREDKTRFILTETGKQQLAAGIYEEEQEEEFQTLIYSLPHATFMPTTEDVEFLEEPDAPFRYASEVQHGPLDEELLLEGIRLTLADHQEHAEGFVETVDSLASFDEGELQWVTCLEFRLYDAKENMTFVRVWNPLLASWDSVLEELIEHHEAPSWA